MKNATSITQVNKAIQDKYPFVELIRGKGYYYIDGINEEWKTKIAGLHTSSIGVYSIKHLTVEVWVKSVEDLINDMFA